MTTTPNPTAEQLIAQAALDADTVLPDALDPEEQAADIAKLAAERLRAAGLLGGAPTKEQIERAALALHDRQWRNSDTHPRWGEGGHCLSESGHRTEVMEDANAALTAAAGVAPQAECGHPHPHRDAVCILPLGHESGHMCEKPAPQELVQGDAKLPENSPPCPPTARS